MTIEEVAMGFIRVANETMCRPIRALTQVFNKLHLINYIYILCNVLTYLKNSFFFKLGKRL